MRAYNIRFFVGRTIRLDGSRCKMGGGCACHDDAFPFWKSWQPTLMGGGGVQENRMRHYSGMHPVILLSTYSEPRR